MADKERTTRAFTVDGVPTRTAGEQRLVALEGCSNFRDVGGYPASEGRPVRWRRLCRADGLHRLTGADLETLASNGLLTVLDLRTPEEVGDRGRVSEEVAVTYHHLPLVDVLPDREDLAVWLDADTIASRYREMLESGTDAVARRWPSSPIHLPIPPSSIARPGKTLI